MMEVKMPLIATDFSITESPVYLQHANTQTQSHTVGGKLLLHLTQVILFVPIPLCFFNTMPPMRQTTAPLTTGTKLAATNGHT